jgi:BMFP domain-containing protein YqiC
MSDEKSKIADEFSKIMMGAAGLAQGVRLEAEEILRAQGDKIISSLDLAKREDVDATHEMASNTRALIEALIEKIAALETRVASLEHKKDNL